MEVLTHLSADVMEVGFVLACSVYFITELIKNLLEYQYIMVAIWYVFLLKVNLLSRLHWLFFDDYIHKHI